MRSFLIVRLLPSLQLRSCISQILEPVHVHSLLPQAPVERLNVGIIGRLARPREGPRDRVGIGLGGVKQACLNWEGRGAGPCPSPVQRDHVGTWVIRDVVGPLLHHRPPALEQIGALIGRLYALDDMGETGFGHFS